MHDNNDNDNDDDDDYDDDNDDVDNDDDDNDDDDDDDECNLIFLQKSRITVVMRKECKSYVTGQGVNLQTISCLQLRTFHRGQQFHLV